MNLLSLLLEDYHSHHSSLLSPGFQALAIHRLGNARLQIKPRLLRAPVTLLYRTLFHAAKVVYGIELPYTAKIGRRVTFEHQHGIVIHGQAIIGDGCTIRQNTTLGMRYPSRPNEAPTLGRNVNVGAGACLLGNIHVGDNATIGANAVVTRDVPAGATTVGIPARIVTKSNVHLHKVA